MRRHWNAAARDEDFNGPTPPADVASFIVEHVVELDANIVTLQEMSFDALTHLIPKLGPSWDCHWYRFGTQELYADLRVTCVKGTGTNFRAYRLRDVGLYPAEYFGKEWWAYTQLEYGICWPSRRPGCSSWPSWAKQRQEISASGTGTRQDGRQRRSAFCTCGRPRRSGRR